MNKYYTASMLLCLFITVQSCGVPSTYVKIEPITKSFEVSGQQNELYIKANNWMVENFTNAKSVIQFSDKEAGIVTGKYLLKESFVYTGTYTATDASIFAIIKLQVKDGAAKITVTPDDFTSYNSGLIREDLRYTEQTATSQINSLMDSYENYLKTDTSTDW